MSLLVTVIFLEGSTDICLLDFRSGVKNLAVKLYPHGDTENEEHRSLIVSWRVAPVNCMLTSHHDTI